MKGKQETVESNYNENGYNSEQDYMLYMDLREYLKESYLEVFDAECNIIKTQLMNKKLSAAHKRLTLLLTLIDELQEATTYFAIGF